MEKLVNGDVVVITFPFSDLSASKKRPALVVASLTGDSNILCQITSAGKLDEFSIYLDDSNFKSGSLKQPSLIKPDRLFTADKSLISYKVGTLNEDKTKEVTNKIIPIFSK